MPTVDVELVFRDGSTPVTKEPTAQVIRVNRGEDTTVRFTCYNSDGSARDLADHTFVFSITSDEAGELELINRAGSVTDEPGGIAEAALVPGDTDGLVARTYYASVAVVDGGITWYPLPRSPMPLSPAAPRIPAQVSTADGNMVLVGLPSGGSVGQIPAIATTSPFALEWVDDETGGGGGGGGLTSYNTAALLRAASAPADGTRVDLLGYHAAHDGGGGEFYYDADSTADENGGTVIAPDVGSGRWLRACSPGSFDVRWFGAVGDGTSHPLSGYFGSLAAAQAVYPFATALTNEIDWCAAQAASLATQVYYPDPSGTGTNCYGGEVFFPRGHYLHDSPIAPASGDVFFYMKWRGVGTKGAPGSATIGGASFIMYTGADARYFDLRSSNFVEFHDITFWYDNASFDGILFDCTWMPTVNADTSGNVWRGCTFAGDPGTFSSGQGAHAIISLHLALFCTVEKCAFGQAVSHIRLREFPIGGQPYSNKNIIRENVFQYAKWNIVNVGDNTTIEDNTFEGLGGYTEAAVYDDNPRAVATVPVTFEIVGGGTQTIELVHGGGLTWVDLGFQVGQTPFLLDRQNRVNGPNNNRPLTIASFSAGDTVMHFSGSPGLTTQTNTWGSMSTTGAFVQATPGVEMTFSAAGDSITIDNGRWDTDFGFRVGESEVKISGTTSNDQGLAVACSAISGDGKTITFAGATFVDEAATDAVVTVSSAAGPCDFVRNWCGDQFLPGSAWLRFNNEIASVSIEKNTFAGATRVLELNWGGADLSVKLNTLTALLEPIRVDPLGPGWSKGEIKNNGASGPLFAADSQAALNSVDASLNNPGDDDYIDVTLTRAQYRTLMTIGGDIASATIGTSSTYALLVTQGGAGSAALGGDADGPVLRFFGNGRINPGDTYTGIGVTAVPTSVLQVNGAIASPVASTQTANFNVGYTASLYPIDATSGNVTATLPAASGCSGREYDFERVDSSGNTVTIAGTLGGDHALADASSRLRVKSDGTNWRKVQWQ